VRELGDHYAEKWRVYWFEKPMKPKWVMIAIMLPVCAVVVTYLVLHHLPHLFGH
jgi:hypothetical protein